MSPLALLHVTVGAGVPVTMALKAPYLPGGRHKLNYYLMLNNS